MSRERIDVFFDPTSSDDGQFFFDPEETVLGGATGVDVILYTKGSRGKNPRGKDPRGKGPSKAMFQQSGGVQWRAPVFQDMEQTLNADHTVLTLRGFRENESQGGFKFEYIVTVEYNGKTFSSASHWPSVSCVPTGGGG